MINLFFSGVPSVLLRSALSLFGTLFFVDTVEAQTARTDPSIFHRYLDCKNYSQFLSGDQSVQSKSCPSIVNFLIEHQQKGNEDFSNQASVDFGKTSGLGFLANLQSSIFTDSLDEAYFWAENADRQVYFSMRQSQDNTRAIIYSSLLSDLKRKFLMGERDADHSSRSEIFGFSNLQEIEFELNYIRSNDPTLILMCLLRIDAFVVPLKEVFTSERYLNCTRQG